MSRFTLGLGNYRGRFSGCSKYLGAYGALNKTSKDAPPSIKLFEKVTWDNWREVAAYKTPTGSGGFNAMAFLPDGVHLASGGQNGVLRIHRVPDLTVVASLGAHTGTVHSLRAVALSSRSGRCSTSYVLSCSSDHWVKVTRVAPSGGEDGGVMMTVIARYCCPVEPLCVSGFIAGALEGQGGEGHGGVGSPTIAEGEIRGSAGDVGSPGGAGESGKRVDGAKSGGGAGSRDVGGEGEVLYVHAGDSGGLLNVLRVKLSGE